MFDWVRRFWHRHSVKWLNHGKPPAKPMNYDYASRFSWTPFYEALPNFCGCCGSQARQIESDHIEIEGEIQPMVVTRYCPHGHGFSIWLA